jgi:3-methylcrotonyl-CoA carboxylase beta subunit
MTQAASSPVAFNPFVELNEEFQKTESRLRLGGGIKAIERQHAKGRLTARERVEHLLDDPGAFTELGLWMAHEMYGDYGGAPGAGVITGVGPVDGRLCMVIANDATVKAGAFFPMTCKKIIRAQTIAERARLPLLYLVDSAGVFLPLQEDVFPDTDDFGRIFRNNAVLSAKGIPQIAAIMGNCVAGGGYLPVLCDSILMTEGSGLYLAGPALVQAAIGQVVTDEELGGAEMHAKISGTIDYREPNDPSCLKRIRALMEANRATPAPPPPPFEPVEPARSGRDVYELFKTEPGVQYDMREVLHCFVDAETSDTADGIACFDEYKAEFGQTVICAYARIGGYPCGIVANQKQLCRPGEGALQMGGVIYHDSANKAARFIMDCNQKRLPIIFVHDTTGFMVGKESENHGIIRAGAKMVNAMSNCIVPKIALLVGGSYGAGNYAMCGRAFDPFLTLAWPMSRCAVMGANQATGTLAMIEAKSRERKGVEIDDAEREAILKAVHDSYTNQADIRYGAARGWVDRMIQPHETRKELIAALRMAQRYETESGFTTGVLQT